jgi:hypothetical protein
MDRSYLSTLRPSGNTERGCVHHDRRWWLVEARRFGSDWLGILRLQAEVVTAWRARHDPETGAAARATKAGMTLGGKKLQASTTSGESTTVATVATNRQGAAARLTHSSSLP